MVTTDNTQPDEVSRQALVEAENRRNRTVIADAIKQMVLIIISLGFSTAYTLLSKPDEKGLHFFSLLCSRADTPCHVDSSSLSIFAIYVFIGTRFLLTSWLYLSSTYRDDNPKKLRILPDAIGIFLTGVFIGVQSAYASVQWMSDFFMLFCLVLLIDVVFSIASVVINWEAVRGEGLRQELLWIGNNVVFGIAIMFALREPAPSPPVLMALAFLNCTVSFGISWFWYFRSQRPASTHADHDLMAVVFAKRDGAVRAEEVRQWLSAAVARDRH
jgi:hypothetical protein